MVTIAGRNVPPELADLYADYVSPASAAAPNNGAARARRQVKRLGRETLEQGRLTAIERIVEGLARAYGRTAHTHANNLWRQQRAAELYDGYINPDYWIPAKVLRQGTYQVLGIGAEELPRPPYAYETPTNRPTITTWQGITPSAGDPIYQGSLSAELFRDDVWRYRQTVALLNATIDDLTATPAFAYYDGAIQVDTDRRGSRAMFSLLSHVEVVPDTASLTDPPRPPIDPATSLYWRYKTPVGTPPYYHHTQPRRVLQQIPRVAENASGSVMAVTLATRPMSGHANNNNTTVETRWLGTETIYTVRPCGGADRLPAFQIGTEDNSMLYAFDHMTGRVTEWKPWFAPLTRIAHHEDMLIVQHTDYSITIHDASLTKIADLQPATNPRLATVLPYPYQGGYASQIWEPALDGIHFLRATWNLDGTLRAETDVIRPEENPTPDTEYSWQQWPNLTWPCWTAPNGYYVGINQASGTWMSGNGYPCAYMGAPPYAADRYSFALFNTLGRWYVYTNQLGDDKIIFTPWPYDLTDISQPHPLAPYSVFDPPARLAVTFAGETLPGYPWLRPVCAALDNAIFIQCENGTAWIMDHLGNTAETNPIDGQVISTRLRACNPSRTGAIPR